MFKYARTYNSHSVLIREFPSDHAVGLPDRRRLLEVHQFVALYGKHSLKTIPTLLVNILVY